MGMRKLLLIISILFSTAMVAQSPMHKLIRKKAASGDVRAIEVMLDRAYGKSRQFLDISAEVNTIKIIRE